MSEFEKGTMFMVVSMDGETFFPVNEAMIVAVPPSVQDDQDAIERWVNKPDLGLENVLGIFDYYEGLPYVAGPIRQLREFADDFMESVDLREAN